MNDENLTPTVNITNLNPFGKLCMTIGMIPSSYKLSMTYEEQLLWFCNFLENTVIPTVDNNAEAVTELQNLYIQLKNYIDNYFTNLDVQNEINNKLDEMATSGYFNNIFSKYFQEIDELKTEFRPNNVPINMSDLSQDVKEALTGGSVAVVGINSVNTDNIVNKAVNYQKVTDNILLSQNLNYSPSYYNVNNFLLNLPFEPGSIQISNTSNPGINQNSTETYRSSNYITFTNSIKLIPQPNFQYGIIAYSKVQKPSNIFYWDSSLFEIGAWNIQNGTSLSSTGFFRSINYIDIQEETHLLVDDKMFQFSVLSYNEDNTFISSIPFTSDYTLVPETNVKYKITVSEINFNRYITGPLTPDFSLVKNQFFQALNQNYTTTFETNFHGWKTSQFILDFNPNYIYRLLLRKNPISEFTENPCTISNWDYSNIILIGNNIINKNINKSFSVIGDSFSAYNGIIPSSNLPYYYGNNAGVSSVNDMWWEHLVNENNCTRKVINAWSGSSISSINASSSNVPMSDSSRCQNLGENPEMIIILGGTNDFSHANPNIGSYNGLQTFPTTNNDFRSAYALMLQRIRQAYPNSDIFCCSLPFFVRVPTNKFVPQQNSEPQTVTNYSNAIKEIANLMNCQFIDLSKCGFTPTNYYPTYCIDSETNPTHPNAKGQKVIADVISNYIYDFYNRD